MVSTCALLVEIKNYIQGAQYVHYKNLVIVIGCAVSAETGILRGTRQQQQQIQEFFNKCGRRVTVAPLEQQGTKKCV
jgi:hypothetical protein